MLLSLLVGACFGAEDLSHRELAELLLRPNVTPTRLADTPLLIDITACGENVVLSQVTRPNTTPTCFAGTMSLVNITACSDNVLLPTGFSSVFLFG